MTSKIVYTGGLHTEAAHLQSGSIIHTDAPVDNNGKGEAFSPTDLLATSLGCCMLTIMGITAAKNNIPFENAAAEVTKNMEANPRRVGEVVVAITIPKANYTADQKKN